jgi:murein L,D-transpeptidase YcbB/YkuD
MDKNRSNGSPRLGNPPFLQSSTMKNTLLFFCVSFLFCACGQTLAKPKDAKKLTNSVAAFGFASTQLSAFSKKQKISDSATDLLSRFYTARNYQYAWFTETGVAEYSRIFWNLHNEYIHTFADTSLSLGGIHQYLDAVLTDQSNSKLSPDKRIAAELQLTLHFFVYANNAYAGRGNLAVMEWHIPRKELDEVGLLNSFIARGGKDLEGWEPVNMFYRRLKKELIHYMKIKENGGWKSTTVEKARTYRPGDSSLVIKQVKSRLAFTTGGKMVDTTSFYNNELLSQIKLTQKSFGLKEDGIINTALLTELNVPVAVRITQLLINLERMRWLPVQPSGEFIGVNIPEFRLHFFEGERKIFSIDIVVGQAAHNTVIFADKLKFVVFSPYWNIPPSIVRKEIVPAIRKNGNYLSKNNMERTGYTDGLPVIRQKPGGANALGRVKFLFPNSYNIYFHDTPARSLFEEDARAFSHGCMRLAEPVKLATYLLRNQPEWTTQKMNEALNASTEKWVTLKQEVPVFITYFTAWVDSNGLLNFRKDIYAHDKEVAKNLVEQ